MNMTSENLKELSNIIRVLFDSFIFKKLESYNTVNNYALTNLHGTIRCNYFKGTLLFVLPENFMYKLTDDTDSSKYILISHDVFRFNKEIHKKMSEQDFQEDRFSLSTLYDDKQLRTLELVSHLYDLDLFDKCISINTETIFRFYEEIQNSRDIINEC